WRPAFSEEDANQPDTGSTANYASPTDYRPTSGCPNSAYRISPCTTFLAAGASDAGASYAKR
ncbi:MAG: hypothetical protein SPF81_03825, partial [Sodaliphilus sp.]|nr:hypothetical protein [Sodaliphilus sp.]